MTKAATRDGHHLEFDIPFDQLGFGGKPFKEVNSCRWIGLRDTNKYFIGIPLKRLGPVNFDFAPTVGTVGLSSAIRRPVTECVLFFLCRSIYRLLEFWFPLSTPLVRIFFEVISASIPRPPRSSRMNQYCTDPLTRAPLAPMARLVGWIGLWVLWHGTVARQMGFIQPTTYALINVTDFPFFVVPLNEIEHVHFERVLSSSKTCDMKIIMKVQQYAERCRITSWRKIGGVYRSCRERNRSVKGIGYDHE